MNYLYTYLSLIFSLMSVQLVKTHLILSASEINPHNDNQSSSETIQPYNDRSEVIQAYSNQSSSEISQPYNDRSEVIQAYNNKSLSEISQPYNERSEVIQAYNNQSSSETSQPYNDRSEINQPYNFQAFCLQLRCHRSHQTCCKPIFYSGKAPKLYCCDPGTYHVPVEAITAGVACFIIFLCGCFLKINMKLKVLQLTDEEPPQNPPPPPFDVALTMELKGEPAVLPPPNYYDVTKDNDVTNDDITNEAKDELPPPPIESA